MRITLLACALVAPWICAAVCAGAEPPKDTRAAAVKPADEPTVQRDLDEIQGLWVRSERSGLFGSRRITKEIKGDAETMTYYDTKGNVEIGHTVKVSPRRAGPIRIFAYSDQQFTAGPNKGNKGQEQGEYIYKIVGNTFVEIWGVLGDADSELRVLKWNREKAAKAP